MLLPRWGRPVKRPPHGPHQVWWLCLRPSGQHTSIRLHTSWLTSCQVGPTVALQCHHATQLVPSLQSPGLLVVALPCISDTPWTWGQPSASAGLLGTEISTATPLMEAGLDSIGAVEMRNAVNDRYGIELPATIMFDYPTIGDLAQYLALRTASSAMHASAGGLDQMQAYVPDAAASLDIAKVLPAALAPSADPHQLPDTELFW